jgi:hypothetical protein
VEKKGEGSVYSDQQTNVIETTPVVKSQSTSTVPGIDTTPRSVVQVPEEEKEKDEESGHVDDDVCR